MVWSNRRREGEERRIEKSVKNEWSYKGTKLYH